MVVWTTGRMARAHPFTRDGVTIPFLSRRANATNMDLAIDAPGGRVPVVEIHDPHLASRAGHRRRGPEEAGGAARDDRRIDVGTLSEALGEGDELEHGGQAPRAALRRERAAIGGRCRVAHLRGGAGS